jgi:hypothetical protein
MGVQLGEVTELHVFNPASDPWRSSPAPHYSQLEGVIMGVVKLFPFEGSVPLVVLKYFTDH